VLRAPASAGGDVRLHECWAIIVVADVVVETATPLQDAELFEINPSGDERTEARLARSTVVLYAKIV
jgi:hypothetical protein